MALKDRGIKGGDLMPVAPVIGDNISALPVETRIGESVDVYIQDQNTILFDVPFLQIISTTSLAEPAIVNSYTATITAGHGFTGGEDIGIYGAGERIYFGKILSMAGDVATLDTPLQYTFNAGDVVAEILRNMNVNGSVTRQRFWAGPTTNITIDINRIIFLIKSDVAMDEGKFGGLAALTRGVVLRVNGDVIINIGNFKTSGDLSVVCYDAVYEAKAPAGQYAYRAKYLINDQTGHGIAVRLSIGQSIELIIQDDLSALLGFTATIQGHLVEG